MTLGLSAGTPLGLGSGAGLRTCAGGRGAGGHTGAPAAVWAWRRRSPTARARLTFLPRLWRLLAGIPRLPLETASVTRGRDPCFRWMVPRSLMDDSLCPVRVLDGYCLSCQLLVKCHNEHTCNS